MTLLEQARLVLRDLGRRPHKRLGQHFLVDEAVVDRMVAVAKVDRQDSVMEVICLTYLPVRQLKISGP